MQAVVKHFESEISELEARLTVQERETKKADDKFISSVAEQEKLKKQFEAEKKTWAEERAALITRAETAETSLASVKTELTGLTRQISQMTSAIFGKLPLLNLKKLFCLLPLTLLNIRDTQAPGVPPLSKILSLSLSLCTPWLNNCTPGHSVPWPLWPYPMTSRICCKMC